MEDHENSSKIQSKTERRRQFFKSFEAKSLKSRSLLTQISDDLTSVFSSPIFLVIHAVFFFAWITANLGWYPQIPSFDPYPFGFLTMVVSLEAIFLSIFILVSQNRSSVVDTIREEVHLRVNLIAEQEITKILEVLAEMRKEMGIKEKDAELEEMLKRVDTNYIERIIAEQVAKASKPLGEQLKKEFPELLMYPVKKPIELVQNMSNGNSSEEKKH
jgi:uncharacterized membrane protein